MENERVMKCRSYINGLSDLLNSNEELIYEKYDEIHKNLRNIEEELETAVEAEKNKDTTFRIGVIGDIKAGKSTFLNALFFKGKSVLPEAATPMTAALTVITYAEKPSAVIHFFDDQGWKDIVQLSEKYDRIYRNKLDSEYQKYIDSYNLKKKGMNANIHIGSLDTKEQYEKKKKASIENHIKINHPNYDDAKKITDMMSDDLTEYLGKCKEIEYSTMDDLKEYIGANGRFTPIVSYVELRINNTDIKGMEIVDTPGLNDPVKSRSSITKDFLKKCHAVIILSNVSEFLPEATMKTINLRLPSEGVKNYIIVGTKTDDNIRQIPVDKQQKEFAAAYKYCQNEWITGYQENIKSVQKNGIVNGTDIYTKNEPVFVSVWFYIMALKLKKGEALNNAEKETIAAIKEKYPDFSDDADSLAKWSQMGVVRKRIKELTDEENQKRIIEEKNDSTPRRINQKVSVLIEDLISKAAEEKKTLNDSSAEELKKKKNDSRYAIDSSRAMISSEFRIAANQAEKNMLSIRNKLLDIQSQYIDIRTTKTQVRKKDEYRTGFLGSKRNVDIYNVEINHASVSNIDENIKKYITNCNKIISGEFDLIVDKDRLSNIVAEIMTKAFSKTESEFDPNDVLVPLRELFSKIVIPKTEIQPSKYTDRVHTEFACNDVTDSKINDLAAFQSQILTNIYNDYSEKLDENLEGIRSKLEDMAANFSDAVDKKISGVLERLSKQAEEKDKFTKRYETFLNDLRIIKNKYRD